MEYENNRDVDNEISLVGGTLFSALSVYKKRETSESRKMTEAQLFAGILQIFGNGPSLEESESEKFVKEVSSYKYCKKNGFQGYVPIHEIRKLQGKEFDKACLRVKEFVDTFIQENKEKEIISTMKCMVERDYSIDCDNSFIVDQNGTKRTRKQIFDQLGFSFIPFLTSVILYAFSRNNTLGAMTIASWSIEGKRSKILVPNLETCIDSIYIIEECTLQEKSEDNYTNSEDYATSSYKKENDLYKHIYHYSEERFNSVFIEANVKVYDFYDRSKSFKFFHLNILDSDKFETRGLIKYLQDNLALYFYSQAESREMFDNGSFSMSGFQAIRNMKKLALKGTIIPDRAVGEMLISVFLEVKGSAHKIMSKVQLVKDIELNESKTDGIHLGKDGTIYFASSCIDGDLLDAVDSAFERIEMIKMNCENELFMVKENAFKMLKDKNDIRILEDAVIPKPEIGSFSKKGYGVFIGYNLGLDPSIEGDDYLQKVKTKIVRDSELCYDHVRTKVIQKSLWNEKISFFLLPFNNIEGDVKTVFEKLIEV